VCTALQWARMLDLQNTGAGPARLFDSVQFYNPLTGQDSITWDQCCNASISTSRVSTNMMMHLDFSFAGWAIPYVNNCQVYGQHDIVFITRYDDVVMRHYVEPGLNDLLGNTDTCLDVPASNKPYPIIRETQFHHPEWSNHPYYAAANLYVRRRWCRDSTGYRPPGNDLNEWKHEVVYLLDLKDSIYLPVVRAVDYSPARTVEMQWPYVWIEVPSGFQEDTSWLAQPRIPNAVREPAPALRPQGMRLELQDARLVSGTPLRSVRVYTVLGTLVEERTARAGARAVTLSRRAPGIYFVQAIDRDGQRTTLRWTVPR